MKKGFENLAADYHNSEQLNYEEVKMFKDRKYSLVSNEVQN